MSALTTHFARYAGRIGSRILHFSREIGFVCARHGLVKSADVRG